MPITRDTAQDCVGGAASTTTATATFPGTVPANKLIIAVIEVFDQKLNTNTPAGYTKVIDIEHNSQTFSAALFAKVAAGTETNVVVTKGGAAAEMRMWAAQYSGALTVTPWDKTASAQSGGTLVATQPTGTFSTNTAQADELLIPVIALNGAGTAFTFTNAGAPVANPATNRLYIGERAVNVAATYGDTGNWTSTVFACALIASFMAAPVVASPTVGMY